MLATVALTTSTSGCYYSHLASGQLRLLWEREPIDRVLEDPSLPDDTRALLRLVPRVRAFARDLGLEVGDQYTSFVDWPGDRVVTTLVRTRPPSVEAIPYWFPILGELPYKGYFDRALAEAEAERLRSDEAYDVCVSGVSAYSTLGWMDDPVTAPMLRRGPAVLVETLLHELVHATAFVADDVDFNESVAQFIGQEAAIRFFERTSRPDGERGEPVAADEGAPSTTWPDAERVRASILDRRAIARATWAFRQQLVELATPPKPNEAFAEVRRRAEEAARARLAALPLRVLDPEQVAQRARLSNACLALRGTYVRDLPRHAAVLDTLGGDLTALVRRLVRVAEGELSPEAYYQRSITREANRRAQ